MQQHAEEAMALAQDRTRADLDGDRVFNLALVRLLEIVGEAAARVTPATRARSSSIPWADIVGLRNRLIHGYNDVDFNLLWQIVQNDLPPLVTALRALLASDEPDNA
jgi:uncharacterized protein with HEPN domain